MRAQTVSLIALVIRRSAYRATACRSARGRVPAAHCDEYPLTPDECAAIAESAETWCRRWSAWQSDSIADVARLMARRLCGSAPTFVRRGRAWELQRHGRRWTLHVQQEPGLTLREPVVEGQHCLVVNCDDQPLVTRIWVLWHAQHGDFEIVREAGSPSDGSLRRALLHTFPYAVYFRTSDEAVVVLAVLHLRRNPKVWRGRAR